MIITSGYRVSPQEVEGAIADHPAVADAAVIGVPDDERGTVPKAFVVTTDEDRQTPELKERIGDRVKDGLAPYEYPRTIEFVDELPKTSTGKVRRQTLRERAGITDS
ncbi:AMP-binding enzyme [Natrinema saccharevitans]|uniref:AMP-binding enzyme n=1 Tax=Natrinema saccharevitans TaxID=301967 RepID=UPI001FEBF6CF|nr:hypothetical protein [Natrinema saccharevitans]